MSQVQIITGPERHRRWSEEQKQTLVAAAFAPGAVVVEVVRRADVSSTLLYRWRREFEGAAPGLARVVLAGAPLAAANSSDSAAPVVEIDFGGGVRVRLAASVPPALAAAVV